MVLGAGGGETIAFGIKAIADLRGVDQTAKALTGLGRAGNQLGQGVAQSSKQASAGLLSMQTRADSAAHSLRGIAAASAGILGVGVALFKVGEGFDKALDTIRIGTGATGKALDDLGNDARAVFREVPTDLQTVATAITELNRRTGDTGKGLQELARAELELSEITKTDLNQNIADTSKLFEQWGIAVEEQVPTLDKLFRASQQTGVSVDSLASSLTQYGPILRTMGFGLDESIALLATLNKAGVNTGQVITGLRTAIAKFAASGVTDLGQALKDVFAQIKNAPDDVAAASIAIDTFGVRAGPALAENIRSGKLSYQDLVDTISNGNETIGKAVDETQDFAEKMHILRNRAADALIPLGIQMFNALNALIPAMTKVSQGAELLGQGFGKLPGPVKAVVAAAIVAVAAVAGVSFVASTVAGVVTRASSAVIDLAVSMGLVERESFGAAAGIARVGTAARSASASMTDLALAEDAAAGSAVAANTKSTLFLGTLGKLGGFAARGIVIAVSLVGLELIADSIQHAIEGPQSGASQNDRIATRIESGIGGALDHVPGPIGDWLKHDADETANDTALFGKVGDLGLKIHQSFVGGLLTKTGDAEIEGLGGLTVKDIQKGAEESGRSFSDELIFQADALGVVTPQITAYKEARDAAAKSDEEGAAKAKTINDALNEQIDITDDQIIQSIEARRQQEALSKAVQDTENKAFLAGGKFENWMRPFIESASDAQAEAEKLTKDEQAMIDTSLDVIRGVQDIDPSLDGTQKGFRDLGDSIVDVTRDMDDVGVLNLSPATREALDLASALSDVDENLTAVHQSISQNNADISAWQQNISDVVDVTGADSQQIEEWRKEVENGSLTIEQAKANVAGLAFPGLDALFNAGLLSADELKSAREASIAIIQRSIGGIQDEHAAQAKLLPTLKDVQDAHDNVDGAIKNETRSQKELDKAYQSPNVQEFLRTYEKLLSEGKPPDVVTKYVVDSAQADKDIQTVAQDLGLIPDEKSTVVSATVNDAIAKLHEVQGVIVDTTADGATITVSADTEAAANQFLALNDDVLSKLDGRELVVKVKGDNGEWETIKDTVIAETIPDKTVNILPGKIGPIPLEGGIPVQSSNPTDQTAVTQPAAVTVTAEDGVSPVLDKINSDLDTFSTQATSTANATGQAIATGLMTGFQIAAEAAGPAISTILGSLNIGNLVYNYGFNDGFNFGVGLANGISATANAVFNAAFNVGYLAHLGTQAGMDAHSPSRLAAKDGQNWVDSFVAALNNGKQSVREAAAGLAAEVGMGGLGTTSLQSMVLGDRRAQSVLAASSVSHSQSTTSHVVNLGGVHVHGVTDPAAVGDRVVEVLYRTFDRLDSSGLFGR